MSRPAGLDPVAGMGSLAVVVLSLAPAVLGGAAETSPPAEATARGAAAAQELPDGVTPAMVERGGKIFTDRGLCYTCHGADGRGREGLGNDLTDREWAHGDGSYEYLVSRIEEGVTARRSSSGVPMPPRAGAGLSDEQVRAVAAYVWTLSRTSSSPGR